MPAADRVVHIPRDQRKESATGRLGFTREQAIAHEGLWAGVVKTDPGRTSGWHHHGDYDTSIYVTSGSLTMESGPGGADVIEAGPDDFLFVPKGAIHRERNLGDVASHAVVVRAGSGPATVDVDGPAPG